MGSFISRFTGFKKESKLGEKRMKPSPKERANWRKPVIAPANCQTQFSTIRRVAREFPVNADFFNIRPGSCEKSELRLNRTDPCKG